MAINKNFVIKNGLEVNTNVLVAASDEKQVGIGTTRPYYKLHVGGGEGNRGGIGATDLTISGIATLGVGNSSQGALNVVGISTFDGDIDLTGSAGVSTVLWDASENRLEFKDNASVGFGTGNDLTLYHDGTTSFIKDTVGDLRISGDKITLELEDGTDVKVIDQYGVNITGVTTTNRLLVSGVSTFTGAIDANSTSDFGANVTVSAGNVTVSSGNVTLGTGVTVTNAGNIAAAGIVTANGGIKVGAAFTVDSNTGNVAVTGILTVGQTLQAANVTGTNVNIAGLSTFADTVDINGDVNLGNATSDTITATGRFDSDIVPSTDGARDLGASGLEFKDLYIDGTANIDALLADTAKIGDLTDNRVVIAGSSGELEDSSDFTFDGNQLKVGLGTIQVNGNAAFAGIVTVGGDLYVAGDITYDEITGRNLNITGITTLADQVNFGTSGIGATIFANGNATISGILTAKEFVGVFTSAGGAGIGIGSTTAHVGYGITYIDFKGPGVSTVYASSVTGITTIYFQGGGGSSVGAAGTWQNDGAQGISTAKSVGINTVGVAVTALQGGEKGASSGIGQTFQGLYISNGMVVNDNALNGNHYIGTAFGGVMAGPVTVNGIITVDGNWAVV